jgi:hypothetical protein
MKKKKPFIVILIGIFLIVVGFFVAHRFINNNQGNNNTSGYPYNTKTHKDTKYNFSLEYPEKFNIKENKEKNIINFDTGTRVNYNIWIISGEIEDFIIKRLPNNKKIDEKIINNIKVIIYEEDEYTVPRRAIVPLTENEFLVFSLSRTSVQHMSHMFNRLPAGEIDIFNQILSTFRFVE